VQLLVFFFFFLLGDHHYALWRRRRCNSYISLQRSFPRMHQKRCSIQEVTRTESRLLSSGVVLSSYIGALLAAVAPFLLQLPLQCLFCKMLRLCDILKMSQPALDIEYNNNCLSDSNIVSFSAQMLS
jgi:hypothetical protein